MPSHHGKSGTSAGVPQGYQDVHQTGAVSQTPGRTREVTSTGNGTKSTDAKPLIDIKKTGENIAVSQGLQYAGIDPISSMLIGPALRHFKKKQPDTYWERGDRSRLTTTTGDKDTGPTGREGEGGKPTGPTVATKPIKRTPLAMKPYYMGFDFQKDSDSDDHSQHAHKHQLGVSGQKVPDPRKRTYQGWEFKKGGLSGGKRFGPPPKKGPNPHGKCPFRPDGIRGVGAVKPGRGVKFIGTK